ncbi:glycolate oxidase iron-sulfur subunit [Pseudomonas laurylsulfativorans]|uniref:Glycolate oxidase iron-sulfur subunit n=1 Tax=Pseudomonas laurylsulfativorans TaxID=1943631 RepID=A0A2S3VR32_9PSED|nr:glycolate oxidase subunit GlcF [Pseudomonas laurylsulfativorans]POF42415.1 glycolate oxidase iron-sulfur subunit [Pseudomonas laurylsulfativorans]
MQTTLSEFASLLPRAAEAERILRSCVHCGFCNATCPTYQLLGDELDGPRGRIYLIKQVLEGNDVTQKTQQHLDRCLSCRNCETTCPSGVDYHNLLDIGRAVVDAAVQRPLSQRLLRKGLRTLAPNPGLFKGLVSSGQMFRALLPSNLETKLPRNASPAKQRPTAIHDRQMLILEGCVQSSLSPNTNAAAVRVLDQLGISVTSIQQAVCCGAVDYHLDAQASGLNRARRNIDAWWPSIESGAEAIVQTASGCGAFIKEYAHLLSTDPAYAYKAKIVSSLAKDLVEVLRDEPLEQLGIKSAQRLAFHCPCTLQHAQKLGGAVEALLGRLGFNLTTVPDSHLCCGSAGTYSLTQPELSRQLRDNKLNALESGNPEVIVTANIGCQTHLDGAGRTPVRHWIELVESSLP